jgi:hypothetical protein
MRHKKVQIYNNKGGTINEQNKNNRCRDIKKTTVQMKYGDKTLDSEGIGKLSRKCHKLVQNLV